MGQRLPPPIVARRSTGRFLGPGPLLVAPSCRVPNLLFEDQACSLLLLRLLRNTLSNLFPHQTSLLCQPFLPALLLIGFTPPRHVRAWPEETVRDTLDRKITFEDQETAEIKNRLKAAWAAFHKYRQELTSKDYRLRYRLRLFNMVVTPTLTYASGTWTLTQKHENMIKTAQRKMLRFIVQTKRKYKSKMVSTNKKGEEPEMSKDKDNENISEKDTEDDSQQDSNKDHDSEVSFQEEVDEGIDATENEEDWIELIKRSTKEAEEHMEKHEIPCWIELHRTTKWRMARRIVFLNNKRWNKSFVWHPGLDTSIRTGRQIGRPKRRWEDDLNDFSKMEGSHVKSTSLVTENHNKNGYVNYTTFTRTSS